MAPKHDDAPRALKAPVDCALTGAALLGDPLLNKGSAFTKDERDTFGLSGLLPSSVQTLDDQVKRAYAQYSMQKTDISKNTFLTSLKDQNQVLYYKLLLANLKEMFPIVYTPTEGTAIADFSHLFRRPEGCFLDINEVDRVERQLAAFGQPEDIDIIVVSDGEQILGIGDQGVGGVLISVAKLVLYTLCGGLDPARGLPIGLDCGTDDEKLLHDPLYLGNRHKRVRGKQYDQFIDHFVSAAKKRFPKAYIHFEDFGLNNARYIIDEYKDRISCFNDDIQGTGCVTLAAIYAAAHVAGLHMKDLRVVIFGAGSAGMGIADQVSDAIAVESGLPLSDARKHIFCVDKPGLLLTNSNLTPAQRAYAKSPDKYSKESHDDLVKVIRSVQPHVLIGTSTKPGAFTQEVVQAMDSARKGGRPIIFPLSNPTRLHEAVPEDLLNWTNGRALVVTGSPFDPVDFDGRSIDIAECNNASCFPGIGLGVAISGARLLTKEMLVAATKALAALAPALKDSNGALLPDIQDVRDTSRAIAVAVIKSAVQHDLATAKDIPENDDELSRWVEAQLWWPEYRSYKAVRRTEEPSSDERNSKDRIR